MTDPIGPAPTGLAPVRDAIWTQLADHPRMLGVGLFLDAVTGGASTVLDANGRLKPYVVITFGSRSRVRSSAEGIVGAKSNLKLFSFGVEMYAKDAKEVGRVEDDLIEILEGWEPPMCSEITAGLSGIVTNPLSFQQGQTRDGRGIIFSTYFDQVPAQ